MQSASSPTNSLRNLDFIELRRRLREDFGFSESSICYGVHRDGVYVEPSRPGMASIRRGIRERECPFLEVLTWAAVTFGTPQVRARLNAELDQLQS